MKISVVTTLYHSSTHIEEFHQRITNALQVHTNDYEIIMVDDGSPDNSLKKAIKIAQLDKKVVIVELSRNFGHHKAIKAGLEYAEGEFVFLIDSDLEEEPELLKDFLQEMQNQVELDVVFGVQEQRKGNWFERNSGKVFYKVFNWLSDENTIEPNFLTIRLMKSNFVKELIKVNDQEFYFAPANSYVGFNKKSIVVKKNDDSKTTYTFSIKFHMLLNSILANTSKPLYFIFYTGISITLLSIIIAIYYMTMYFNNSIGVSGWTTIILLNVFFGGIIILFIGIIAIYVSKIFNETKKRPTSIIRKIHKQL